MRLSEREQAEGRTGGQAGHRIVYDDAAIERLLDRWATEQYLSELVLGLPCQHGPASSPGVVILTTNNSCCLVTGGP